MHLSKPRPVSILAYWERRWKPETLLRGPHLTEKPTKINRKWVNEATRWRRPREMAASAKGPAAPLSPGRRWAQMRGSPWRNPAEHTRPSASLPTPPKLKRNQGWKRRFGRENITQKGRRRRLLSADGHHKQKTPRSFPEFTSFSYLFGKKRPARPGWVRAALTPGAGAHREGRFPPLTARRLLPPAGGGRPDPPPSPGQRPLLPFPSRQPPARAAAIRSLPGHRAGPAAGRGPPGQLGLRLPAPRQGRAGTGGAAAAGGYGGSAGPLSASPAPGWGEAAGKGHGA